MVKRFLSWVGTFRGVGIAKDSYEILVEIWGNGRNSWCLIFQNMDD